MRDSEMKLLFEVLSQILSNQNDIKKYLGLNKRDSEYGLSYGVTSKLSSECDETASDYEHDDDDYDCDDYW